MFGGAEPLLLLGAGRMGGSLLERWLQRGLTGAETVVIDPFLDDTRRDEFLTAGVSVVGNAAEVRGRAFKTMLLGVKPQVMDEALADAVPLASAETMIISIAAGVRLAQLAQMFPAGQPVVRAMPNTPAQIGQGVTVAVPNQHVSPSHRSVVDALLGAVGKVAWVDDERLIDAVTAVSGSGPAYVFLLAECLEEAARRAGLPHDLAALLGRETVAGAGALLSASPLSPSVLRQNVTSPGGTTAAALSVLMAEEGLQTLMTRAVDAARRRSLELG